MSARTSSEDTPTTRGERVQRGWTDGQRGGRSSGGRNSVPTHDTSTTPRPEADAHRQPQTQVNNRPDSQRRRQHERPPSTSRVSEGSWFAHPEQNLNTSSATLLANSSFGRAFDQAKDSRWPESAMEKDCRNGAGQPRPHDDEVPASPTTSEAPIPISRSEYERSGVADEINSSEATAAILSAPSTQTSFAELVRRGSPTASVRVESPHPTRLVLRRSLPAARSQQAVEQEPAQVVLGGEQPAANCELAPEPAQTRIPAAECVFENDHFPAPYHVQFLRSISSAVDVQSRVPAAECLFASEDNSAPEIRVRLSGSGFTSAPASQGSS